MIKKSFQILYENLQIQISYQPSNIQFSVTDTLNNSMIKEAMFYDTNLPQQIKHHFSTVYDVYNQLQLKQPSQIELQNEYFKFKSSKSTKSDDWLACQLNDNISHDLDMKQLKQKLLQSQEQMKELCLMKDEVQDENAQLRKQISLLKRINKFIQRQYKIIRMNLVEKRRRDQICGDIDFEDIGHNEDNRMLEQEKQQEIQMKIHIQKYKQQFQKLDTVPLVNFIQLIPSQAHYRHYEDKFFIQNNVITKKRSSQPQIIIFQPIVNNKNQSINAFSILIKSQLYSNFLVIGLTTSQHFNKPFCYFFNNCIALSNSLGLLMIQLQMIDLGFTLKKNDSILLFINNKTNCIQWLLNGQLLSLHKIPQTMINYDLYAYIIMANQNDCIEINHIMHSS